jgi:hypothetical protein
VLDSDAEELGDLAEVGVVLVPFRLREYDEAATGFDERGDGGDLARVLPG